MWRVIRTPLVSLCSRTSEYSAQSMDVIRGYVNEIKMFCRFSKEPHSTARNTESRSKLQVQWKLRIWKACEQRCARHHAVCWWPRWQDGYMQCELTVACYIIGFVIYYWQSWWNCIWNYKQYRGYYMPKMPIIVVFWFLCYVVDFLSSNTL